MRINRQSSLSRTASAKRSQKGARASQQFTIEQSTARSQTSTVQGPRSLGPVDALLALQEVPDATTSTRRAVEHAEKILDALEDMQMGLVVGSLPKGQLNRLLSLIRREKEQVSDPKLAEVIKEVELRAHVELAKLGEFA